MPRYIYRCGECENEFETFHSISERLKDCQKCEEEGTLFRVPSFYVANIKDSTATGKVGDVVKSKIEEFKQDLKEEKRTFQEKEYE